MGIFQAVVRFGKSSNFVPNFAVAVSSIHRNTGCERRVSGIIKNIKLPSIHSMTDDELFEDESICFIHSSRLFIHDFDLGIKKFKVNYDRYNHGLVGMNILSQLDFHCGYSEVLNNYIFIGGLRAQGDKSDYYRALEEHFGILRNSKDVLYQDF